MSNVKTFCLSVYRSHPIPVGLQHKELSPFSVYHKSQQKMQSQPFKSKRLFTYVEAGYSYRTGTLGAIVEIQEIGYLNSICLGRRADDDEISTVRSRYKSSWGADGGRDNCWAEKPPGQPAKSSPTNFVLLLLK